MSPSRRPGNAQVCQACLKLRFRGRAAGGGPDAAPCAAIGDARRRPQQNSQRVLLANPRTAAVSRHGRCGAAARAGRPGGQASRPTATGHECGAREGRGEGVCGEGTRAWGARGAGRRGAGVSAVPGERRFALFGRLDSGARDRFRISGVRLWRARTFRSRQSEGAFFRCRRDRRAPERGMRGTQPHWCWRLAACFGRVKRERKRG